MTEDDRTWTVWLHRDRGRDARSFRLDTRLVVAGALAVLVVIAGAGVALGLALGHRGESRRVAELEGRVQELRVRRDRVLALAARLDSLETAYREVRDLLGAGAGAGGPVPELPSSMAAADVPPSAPGANRLPEGWPLARPGFVTRRFRRARGAAGHPGLDVAVPSGSYVRAVQSGAVAGTGRDSLYGRFVRLAHDGGYRSLYGHASHLFVRPGDSVTRGQVIALSGNSGRSTAPHLHVEVERQGQPVDPLRFLRDRAGDGGAEPAGAAPPATSRPDGNDRKESVDVP